MKYENLIQRSDREFKRLTGVTPVLFHEMLQVTTEAESRKIKSGRPHPQRVVTGGAIALDHPAAKIHVGLPVTADLTRGIDMQTIENNAIFEAFGYENKAQDLMGRAAIAEANKAGVMGQYYGADAVRTDCKNYTLDGSRYAGRTPVFDHSRSIKPNLYFMNSLMGSASDFAANWYASYKRNNPQPAGRAGSPFALESQPGNDYYRTLGYRNPGNTGKLRWR